LVLSQWPKKTVAKIPSERYTLQNIYAWDLPVLIREDSVGSQTDSNGLVPDILIRVYTSILYRYQPENERNKNDSGRRQPIAHIQE